MTTASLELHAPTRAGSKMVLVLLAKASTDGKSPQPVSKRAAKTGVIRDARIVRVTPGLKPRPIVPSQSIGDTDRTCAEHRGASRTNLERKSQIGSAI